MYIYYDASYLSTIGNIIDHAKDEAVNSVDDYLEKDVTELDVSLALKILKTGKSPGKNKMSH